MASLTSFPLAIETTMEYPILFQNLNYHGIGCRLKTVDCAGFRESTSGFLRHVENRRVRLTFCAGKLVCKCRRGRSVRIARLRATGKDFLEGKEDKVSDDALQATIERSKKVLATQRELLQQIAERRKLVSSIQTSVTNSVENEIFSAESESASNLDAVSNAGDTVDDLDAGGHLSGKVMSSLPAKVPEKSSLGLISHSGELERKVIESSSVEKRYSDTDSARGKQLNDVREKISSSFDGQSLKGSSIEKASQNLDFPKATSKKPLISGKSSIEFSHSLDISESIPTKGSSQEKVTSDLNPHEKAEAITSLPAYLSKSLEVPITVDEKVKNSEEPISKQLVGDTGDPAHEDANPPPLAGSNVMNVIVVAAECSPWSKTGGLGDVAGSLPMALARRGHRVMVVSPRYGNYAGPEDTGIRKRYKVDGQDMEVLYYQAYIDGVDFVFIDCPVFRNLENNIYGGNRQDILKRMILFCKAAVEVPWYVPCGGVVYGDGNLVFIANDWHTALLPVYLKAYYRDYGLMNYTRSVLVIHNIAHQGRGPVDDFRYTDLPEHYLDLFRMYDPVGGEHFNIFAAGLKAADRIVSVSHGYAWELKTPEGGWGLHGVINENDWKLRGIVNGIDTKDWNPRFDVHLKSDGYTIYSLETLQIGKPQCKTALQRELNLPVRDDVPLIGFIGRLDGQKGVDIIAEAVPWIVSQDAQLVMLGTGRPDLEQMLRQFESQYHDSVRGWVGFSVQTAHRITAGADILLMPSRFEPCGLNQLYAMSYGTIPVVHAVGGLRDTVQPFDPFNESGLGWTFDRAEAGKLIHALGNCILTYRDYKSSWEGLQRRGMSQDLSWDHAAEIYEEVLVAAKYHW